MKYGVRYSSQFKKDLKRVIKQNKDVSLMQAVIILLAEGEPLPQSYSDHPLTGNWKGYRECHIEPDWLLVYKINDGTLTLSLTRTGTHSDLFNK